LSGKQNLACKLEILGIKKGARHQDEHQEEINFQFGLGVENRSVVRALYQVYAVKAVLPVIVGLARIGDYAVVSR
jgi:hypothetical protein